MDSSSLPVLSARNSKRNVFLPIQQFDLSHTRLDLDPFRLDLDTDLGLPWLDFGGAFLYVDFEFFQLLCVIYL